MQSIKFGTFITVYNNYNNNFCSFINYYIEQLIDTKNKDMDDIIVSFDNYTTVLDLDFLPPLIIINNST